jgi:hypothetical protein
MAMIDVSLEKFDLDEILAYVKDIAETTPFDFEKREIKDFFIDLKDIFEGDAQMNLIDQQKFEICQQLFEKCTLEQLEKFLEA